MSDSVVPSRVDQPAGAAVFEPTANAVAAADRRYRYAFLGPAGTFTEAALRQVVSPEQADYLPQVDVISALEAVRCGTADFAVVAIENSVEGGVTATLDSLASGAPLMLLREMVVPVSFTLAARAGTELASVRRISAHPHAWAQCRHWLKDHLPQAVHVPATSNTAPAKLLSDSADPLGFDAALVPPPAVQHYGLFELAENVADNDTAVTRFVVVGLPGVVPEPTGADKTTLVVHLPHNQSGALLEMLEQFSARGVNLSRIESRPVGDSLGRYSFSVDAEAHIKEARMREVLIGLHRVCPTVRFLGSYPRADGVPNAIRPGTADRDFETARRWADSLG